MARRHRLTSLTIGSLIVSRLLSGQGLTGVAALAAKGDFMGALALATKPCTDSLAAARAVDSSASGVAGSATAALQCVRKGAASVAAHAESEKAFLVAELARAWLAPYETEARRRVSRKEFLGLKWGLGFGFSRSRDASIDDAEIVNGKVRVRSDLREQPRLVLEFHKYVLPRGADEVWGAGPFVAIASSDDKVISGVGMGVMMGLQSTEEKDDGFSLGFGMILDGKVKDLGRASSRMKRRPWGSPP